MLKITRYPKEAEWATLLRRPTKDATTLNATVASVLSDVRQRGDEAVREYEEKFDKVRLDSLLVSEQEMQDAEGQISEEHLPCFTTLRREALLGSTWRHMLAKGYPH